jgi:hypothetical protein
MENKEEFWLEENYITNVDEIVTLAEAENHKFANRAKGNYHEFVNERYGPSKLYTLFYHQMSEPLKEAVIRTINPEHLELPPDLYIINRYDPGGYLVRHRDMAGKHWKFQLIFLRSDKPHLKVYNEKYPEGKLIDEKPGALFHMPLSLEHEVTEIGQDERPKYSLVMSWNI